MVILEQACRSRCVTSTGNTKAETNTSTRHFQKRVLDSLLKLVSKRFAVMSNDDNGPLPPM